MSLAEPALGRLAPSQPILLAVLAWAAGILADRYELPLLSASLMRWWLVAAVLLLASFVLWRLARHRSSALALLLAIACVGGSWHQLHWRFMARDELARFAREAPQPVCLDALVVGGARLRPASPADPLRALPTGPTTSLIVQVTRLRDGREWREVSGNCRLNVAGQLAGVTVGDRLRFFARFERTSPALNPGEYDWAKAERGAGRHCWLFCQVPECISLVEPAVVSSVGRWVDQWRQRCEWRLSQYVGPENSDLAAAVLLGAREQLEETTNEAFRQTGTVHLLVVSGMHVGVLALVIWAVAGAGLLPWRWSLLLTALLVVAYATIAGGRPPVIRAAVLVLLGLSSVVLGRRASRIHLLSITALGVLVYNPCELFRSGTQLSFLCVAALASYGFLFSKQKPIDPLQRLIHDASRWQQKTLWWCGKKMGHLALTSLIVWGVTAPLIAYHFHIVTPVGIAVLPLLWPLIVVALTTGLAICTLGWILPPLASLLGSLCSLCLGATESLVVTAAQLDFGSLYCAGPSCWWLCVFYAGLALPFLVPRFRIVWQRQVTLVVLWIACGFVTATPRNNKDKLHCTFLAMGHGACVVLELPGNQTLLYDAGSLGSPTRASHNVASYLWSRGITRIDAIVLSHADVDHYNAIPGLLERFEISAVYVSPLMFDPWATDGKLTAPEYLREKLAEAGVPLREIWMNDRLLVAHPGVELEILHPPRFGVAGRDNANSIVLSIRFAGRSILLPGDLESPGLEEVTAERPMDVDILLAPHHGSGNSDPPGFAAWCTPDWTVVSGRHDHPSSNFRLTETSYREVGSQILHTASCGAAQFTLTEQTINVTTFRENWANDSKP
ncbi:MAG: ComEC/Rec2 family competence protein [Pirellulales bacterium]|nr:ComEC/Rec2 family competence protein [Pirellulales bacterium]